MSVDPAPTSTTPTPPPPGEPQHRRRPLWIVGATAVAVLAVGGGVLAARSGDGPKGPSHATLALPANGEVFDAANVARLRVAVHGPDAEKATVELDGKPVSVSGTPTAVAWEPGQLPDGTHTLVVSGPTVPGKQVSRTFTVDTTPPALTVPSPSPVPAGSPVTLTGKTDPGTIVQADGQQATASADGTFALHLAKPGQVVALKATDSAGNTATTTVNVVFSLPRTRAVHLTALAWTYGPLRNAVLQMAKDGRLTAVELDIKDESGIVGYASQVPLAKQSGAAAGYYDAAKAVAQLHSLGVRVIGRLVCFRDPKLAEWAWKHGQRDAVIQTTSGTPYTGKNYGEGGFAFTNFANPLVRKYNVDIAVEAAKLGFDDILFDYVRRPDGKLTSMRIPGMSKNPSVDVADFVAQTRAALSKLDKPTYLGVSVFGIAATRASEIAQDVPMLAKHVDYVAPMVYPSHWNRGEYGVSDPNAMPYAIVRKSLVDFTKQVQGTGAVVVPWLQDFSLGVHYSTPQVQAQIKAAHDDGIDDYLLWNAGAKYHADAVPVSVKR